MCDRRSGAFGGNATTAHFISADLSQIYVAASWVGTVELAIVAAVGLVLWLRQRKVRPAHLISAQQIKIS
jgi:hypothetical protein